MPIIMPSCHYTIMAWCCLEQCLTSYFSCSRPEQFLFLTHNKKTPMKGKSLIAKHFQMLHWHSHPQLCVFVPSDVYFVNVLRQAGVRVTTVGPGGDKYSCAACGYHDSLLYVMRKHVLLTHCKALLQRYYSCQVTTLKKRAKPAPNGSHISWGCAVNRILTTFSFFASNNLQTSIIELKQFIYICKSFCIYFLFIKCFIEIARTAGYIFCTLFSISKFSIWTFFKIFFKGKVLSYKLLFGAETLNKCILFSNSKIIIWLIGISILTGGLTLCVSRGVAGDAGTDVVSLLTPPTLTAYLSR